MQALGSAQNGIPFFCSRSDGQVNGLALLLGEAEGARKEFLFVKTEKLVRRQLVLACTRTRQKSEVKGHDILSMSIHAVEDCVQVMKRVVIADHHQDITWPNVERLRSQVFTRL